MKFYRINDVKEITGLSRSSIYAMMQQGMFPKSKKLGIRAVGWSSVDVEEWLNSRSN